MRSLGVFFLLVLVSRTSSAEILYISDGQDCRTLDGGYGNCVLLTSCENPGNFRVRHPPICSFKGKEPVICCPKSRSTVQQERPTDFQDQPIDIPVRPTDFQDQSIDIPVRPTDFQDQPIDNPVRPDDFQADKYCGLLQRSLCLSSRVKDDTGSEMLGDVRSGRFMNHQGPSSAIIFHGEMSEPRVRNYMVLIGYGPPNAIEYRCGGSLIAPKYILSAAHCSRLYRLGPAKWARLGDLDFASLSDDSAIQDREIVDRIVYPEYRNTQVYHDIALFRMDREVDYNPWVSPVCLYTEPVLPEARGTVSGWGRTEFALGPSNHLLEADLDIFNDTYCQQRHPLRSSKSPRGIDSEIMFCAGKIDGSKDACPGDSGGPVVIKHFVQCVKSQVGIVSYGNMCGLPESPGVYTKVSHYVPWIEHVVLQELEETSTSFHF